MAKSERFMWLVFVIAAVGLGWVASWVNGRPWPLLALVVALLAGCVVLAQRGRGDRRSLFPALTVTLAVGLVYLLGLWPRDVTFLGVEPTAEVYLMAAMSLVGLSLGILLAWSVEKPGEDSELVPRSAQGEKLLSIIAWGAVCVAGVNYATGDIPLLASDIDAARFAGDYGVLGRLWPIVFPVLQVALTVRLFDGFKGKTARALMLPGASLGVFILSGARSFILIVVVTLALALITTGRAGLGRLAVYGLGALLIFGLAGTYRLQASDSGDRVSYLAQRGFTGPIGSIDTSLQVGPQVLALVLGRIDAVPFENGAFMVRDLAYFLGLQSSGSDRWVTELLGRDPSVVGGLPPTLAGGLYIDFGWLGVVGGSLLLGFALQSLTARSLRKGRTLSMLAASFFGAYLIISSYSYVSLKPSLIVALGLLWSIQRVDATVRNKNAHSAGFQIP